jgi:hypothetical protein
VRLPVLARRRLLPPLLLVLVCSGIAACAASRPVCEGQLRPINPGVQVAQAPQGARHER